MSEDEKQAVKLAISALTNAMAHMPSELTEDIVSARAGLRACLAQVPRTPAAEWRVKGEADPHGTQYDCERAALTLGNLTDDDLANGAYMNYDVRMSLDELMNPKPGKHMPIVWMTAVKERIRWLSRALEKATKS